MQFNGTKSTTMLNEKVFKYFALIVLCCRKTGSTPFLWDDKPRRLFSTNKFRNKTRFRFSVHIAYLIYCVVKAILLRANVGSFNFCLCMAYAMAMNILISLPVTMYDSDFAALVNCNFRFINEYQSKLINVIFLEISL